MPELPHQTRMTKQRTVILEELRKLSSHPTADELYLIVRAKMPHISLGTVYRNLCFLSEQGKILKLEMPGNVYRFDGNTEPHQHVRCIYCGKVADIPAAREEPQVTDMWAPGFAAILCSRVEYDGICSQCAENSDAHIPDDVPRRW